MLTKSNFRKDIVAERPSSRCYRMRNKPRIARSERVKVVFISSRLRNADHLVEKENVCKAERHCRDCYNLGYVPLAPHVYLPHFLIPGNAEEDAFAARFSEYCISRSDELWCYDGDGISDGMLAELKYANMCGIPIRYESKGEIR